ncbi:hypothetical protein [Algoriphagus antarcticus]|uniref:RiboL-PSP-HEPN domain-containing protein n=1 Tax=Algoriphagus antarcticus TaxID=238540 RepID=A0A3E0DUH1_9BACT|nr:hypothetical protein [Algoriphagus antarcticus]REG88252.1 hypothetical protein C8N25_11030 [Algoriphagus antarcticus]
MTNDTEYFDFGLWWGKIFTSIYGLNDLLSYLGDKESINLHLKKNESVKSFDLESGDIMSANDQTSQLFSSELHTEFENIRTKYLNNLIVFQYSILEQILEESVYLFLYNNSNLLKRTQQINLEFQINKSFDLDILLKTEFTKDVMKSICNRACKYIVTGRIDKSLKRIDKLVGLKFSADIIMFLQNLQDRRNTVVHETKFTTIEIDYFYKLVDIFQYVLIDIEKKIIERNIRYERPFDW